MVSLSFRGVWSSEAQGPEAAGDEGRHGEEAERREDAGDEGEEELHGDAASGLLGLALTGATGVVGQAVEGEAEGGAVALGVRDGGDERSDGLGVELVREVLDGISEPDTGGGALLDLEEGVGEVARGRSFGDRS